MGSALEFLTNPDAGPIFTFTLSVSIFSFLGLELFWMVQKLIRPEKVNVPRQHIEFFWSLIPFVILILLTFVHQKSTYVALGK